MTVRIITGSAIEKLRELPSESIHCVVTSPPYYGLRDYGVAGQIGLESSLDAYVENIVSVFDEVRRIIRPDATLWLNLGDSYASGGRKTRDPGQSELHPAFEGRSFADGLRPSDAPGIKPKDLLGVPWTVAFALRSAGWWLRQDIIWHKPNPMPESIGDRCTKAHEYLFLLTKSERYHYDAAAISEAAVYCGEGQDETGFKSAADFDGKNRDGGVVGHRKTKGWKTPDGWDTSKGKGGHGAFHKEGREAGFTGYVSKSGNKERKPPSERGAPVGENGQTSGNVASGAPWEGTTRNKRSVWTVATSPFAEAHFATFPPALIEPCVLAGCPKGGTVLDPFGGAGTTGLVADRLQRDAILIEINPEYAEMARRRIEGDGGLFSRVAAE